MSRSYKKNLVAKERNDKYNKKCANKKVRKAKDIPNGKAYKKIYCSYDICDYAFMITNEEAIIDFWYKNETIDKHKRFKIIQDYKNK